MSPHTPTIDRSYRRYAELLLQQHRLLSAGKDADGGLETVEEEMTRLWDGLDAAQRRSLSGLGSDLTWVRRRCEPAPRGRRTEEVTPQDFQALVKAREDADWNGHLHHLRLCIAAMDPFQLANQRASAWAAVGFPQIATVFHDLAAELEPSNGTP